MALTITTDLTNITDCETDYASPPWYSIGAQTPSREPDFFAQGANSFSRAVSGAVTKGMVFDLGAGAALDFSSAGAHYNKLIYIWIRSNVPSLMATLANGGLIVRIGSGTPPSTDYKDFYVGGNDFLQVSATTGWIMAVIDPRAPASATGGTPNLAALRYFGGAMTTTTTAKGQNFGIDRISYGRGELRARGTPDSVGGGIREMLNWDWGTVANRYGVLTERAGVVYCKGKLSIGDDVSTNPTDFSTENDVVVWEPTWYYHTATTSIRPTVGYDTSGNWNDGRDSNGVPYYGIEFVGNATTPGGDTKVQFGQKVGTGDTASGRNGPVFIGSYQIPTIVDADDGNVEDVKIYGTTFSNFRDLDFSGNSASTDEFIGNTLLGCGTLQAGPVELRQDTFIDGIGGSYRFMERFLNVDAAAAEVLATADPIVDWVNVVNGTFLSIPNRTAGYVELLDPGGSDQRQVVMVTNDVVGNDDHYAEAIVRWPSGGANQGALGVIIRKDATAATENYYYLKADLLNSQVTLIRCDAGTDTAIAGPTSVTFLEDTDYLLSLRGDGTTIEGFVSGNSAVTKVSATGQSSYQTNRRVGIRGDAEADQTGDAPRLSRFGAGPETLSLGSVRLPATANDDMLNCSFINNARAVSVHDAETFDFSGHAFSGNIVGLRNRSGGTVTINVSGGDSPTPVENEGAGSTTIANTKNISVTTLDADNNPIEDAQVFIQKRYEDTDVGHPGNPFTSSTGNNRTDADFVVTQTPPADLPASGWLDIQDISTGEYQTYRYSSRSGTTFTLPTAVTGTDDGTGNETTINETDIGDGTIVEGDTIRMTNSPFNWAIVLSVSANSVTTTALSGGDSWASEPYGVHTLAVDYVSATDTATVPLMNEETNASGIATESYNYQASPKNVNVRIRKSFGATNYLPLSTQQQITDVGLTLIVTLTLDLIKV